MIRFTGLVLLLFTSLCWSKMEIREFSTTEQEQTYKQLISELRCLVCQNQNIADSNAALAKDLRRQVYEMVQQGKTEQDVIDFMLVRYGDFVLYKPPFKLKTSALWLGPIIFLIIGLIVITLFIKRKQSASLDGVLTNEEKEKVRKLLDEDEQV